MKLQVEATVLPRPRQPCVEADALKSFAQNLFEFAHSILARVSGVLRMRSARSASPRVLSGCIHFSTSFGWICFDSQILRIGCAEKIDLAKSNRYSHVGGHWLKSLIER